MKRESGDGRQGRGGITVHDLAREAGVSLATVDRVLNRRPGVRAATVEKVEAAIARTGYRRNIGASLLARGQGVRLRFLLPGGGNLFMAALQAEVAALGTFDEGEGLETSVFRIPPMNAEALARALDALTPGEVDCVAVVAMEADIVAEAVRRCTDRGIRVVTMVSDIPDTGREAFVGIDNRVAGRMAARMLGLALPRGAVVGLIAGSLGLRDHRERLEGFGEVMAESFGHLTVVGPFEGSDDPGTTGAILSRLLAEQPGLAGLYNAGAGNSGLAAVLAETGAHLRMVAHELTAITRPALESGQIDYVIDQNPRAEVRAVARAARRLVLGPGTGPAEDRIAIRVFLRDNLHEDGF